MPHPLRAKALRCLAQRDHSRHELRRKLLRHAAAQEKGDAPAGQVDADDDAATAIDTLLDALEREGWLSDARFVESRVRLRGSRLGTARIASELAQRGVALSAEAAAGLRSTEYERALAVWKRRFGAPPEDAAQWARQARFMASRGFEADVTRRLLRGVAAAGDGDSHT